MSGEVESDDSATLILGDEDLFGPSIKEIQA